MKILQIRFKNLNSLAGEWHIDFTDPAYIHDGIFAITGPTGSGKTTILDAICLALYGRTPRLDRVNKSTNEIMSRQTGECFAEVTFQVKEAQYRCYWRQHRSRKKADGDLQNPSHELVDVLSGTVLETKLRDVAQAVEEKTGMSFDQFTRSMLLAQGGFDAFLEAPIEERSQILAQITGTEIYTQISIKVHELRAAMRGELDLLRAANGSIQVLDEVDKLALNEQIGVQESLRKGASKRKAEWQAALTWLNSTDVLKKEVAVLDERWAEFEQQNEAFTPDRLRLKLAENARGLQVKWTQLTSLRAQHKLDVKKLEAFERERPGLEMRFLSAKQAKNEAGDQLTKLRAKQDVVATTIKQVRALDIEVGAQQKLVKSSHTEEKALLAKVGEIEARYTQRDEQLATELDASQKAVDYLKANSADADLVENLTALREKFTALRERMESQGKMKADLREAQVAVQAAQEIHSEKIAQHTTQKNEYGLTEARFHAVQVALNKLLQGKEQEKIQLELDQARERKQHLNSLAKGLVEIGELETQVAAKYEEKQIKVDQCKHLALELATAEKEQVHCLEHMQHMQEQLLLVRRVADLEKQRNLLEDGTACPLCGSIDHPYAAENVPQPDDAEIKCSKANDRYENARAVFVSLEKQQSLLKQSLEQIVTGVDELTLTQSACHQQNGAFCAELELDVETVEMVTVEQLKDTAGQLEDEYGLQIVAINVALKEKESAQIAREKVQVSFQQSVTDVREASSAVEKLKLQYVQLSARVEEVGTEVKKLETTLSSQLVVYGVMDISIHALDALDLRNQHWKSALDVKAKGELAMGTLKTDLTHLCTTLSETRKRLKDEQKKLETFTDHLRELTQQRCDQFAEKNPDAEEAVWSQCVKKSEAAQIQMAEVFAELDKERAGVIQQIDELTKKQAERTSLITQHTEDVVADIKAKGFDDEEHYQAALLPEDQLSTLADSAASLRKYEVAISSLRNSKRTYLKQELAKKITAKPREIIDLEFQQAVNNESEIAERIGGLRQQLQDDADAHAKHAEQLKEIEAKLAVCERWDRLHLLIGSADGKKFRNFAQGLTFELVIAQANRQLQKMTDRYLLIHDGKSPLDLNVIDDYQAGEIRSTKNLSGGESFIVSLSLALGLSHMSSRNVRVDSLFLDEGFGTLDEEALETALDTLAGLQEEGKLIGVISHVSLLKERIRNQIEVVPKSGGRSVISGVGVINGMVEV